ncbi:glycosyltransferase [Glacieibacterium frigidum]|uniref:Glycosyltransferase n=1 Tax=Glacieibacterium frigidum TaxID=2593303 RepID=A0A552UF90_9SPHN|nr:glycosyltransferase [Glacieibacterium frigidum]TRW16897.1 glycosyltransferase [Glacieibacterium frigidum]
MSVALVVPMLNEAAALPRLLRCLSALDPAPTEIVFVDGGSADGSAAIVDAAGHRVITARRGRAAQSNAGVAATTMPAVCILHVDTWLPDDGIAVVERTLTGRTVLGGFTAILSGPEKVRWVTSFHNWIKTWYAPLLFRPHLFLRGGRLLFGDHAMFFRRSAFEAVGGFDERMMVMEEADLCVRIVGQGRTRLVNRIVLTSDRRVARWGEWRANWVYLKVGVLWGLNIRPKQLGAHYPDVR